MLQSADTSTDPITASSQADIANRLSQRYMELMPILDFSTALQHVVEYWWEETCAESVLLITPSPDQASIWFHFYSQTRSLSETGSRFPCSTDWAESFLALLEEQWQDLFPGSRLHELRFIPLRVTGPVRGMLVCSFPVTSTQTANYNQAAEITGRFLEQIRLTQHPATLCQLQELKLQSLAEFAAGAGHEINNPLATISGRAQLLMSGEIDPERKEMLSNIGAQALRIRDMIGDLMLFARPPAPNKEPVPVLEVINDLIEKLHSRFKENISIKFDPPEPATLLADRSQLEQVLYSLLENGLLHTPVDQEKTLRINCQPGFHDQLQIDIQSPNSLLSELDQNHLFDPFYSGRQAGRGLGFGLSKTWQIVQQHDALISIQSNDRSGTTVTLHWPTVPQENPPTAPEIELH
ncbi:MAG: HAMP domain-containing histidine kinase [Planctomycetaceae bacterium]|nr:HAMP domain-containing histidine kinase [Planctomycetaceae bacterium]